MALARLEGNPMRDQPRSKLVDVRFDEILVELNTRFRDLLHPATRAQSLILAALAVIDIASSNDRKGVLVTEEEFLRFCGKVYKRVRGAAAPPSKGLPS